MIDLRPHDGGFAVAVIVSAGSSASAVRGIHGAALKIAVRASPEKGKANKEVEEVLADFFGVGKRSVSVISGHTSRNKQVLISGVELCALQSILAQF